MMFRGMRVVVLGAARSGTAVARALVPRGAHVHVLDGGTTPELEAAAVELRALGADVTLGSEDGPVVEAADVIVPSPGIPRGHSTLAAAQARGQAIWSEPEVAWRIARAPILAVTGTNGKTTTTALLGAMLTNAGFDARVGGNIAPGRPLIEIADAAPDGSVLVAEISSFQLEWIQGFRPRIGILTNLSEDHQDRHADMAEYAAAKARLFENQTPEDHAIVNADCPAALAIARRFRATVWTFRRSGEVERGAFERHGAIVFRDGGEDREIIAVDRIRLPGAHNRENAMAAIIAAMIQGASADTVVHALTQFEGVEHRMEWVASIGGADWVNNSMCTNPAALAASVRAYDRPLIVITGGVDKGLDHAVAAAAFARHCRAVLTIGRAGPALARLAREAGVDRVEECGTLDAAVEVAAGLARAGDVVMLAPGCASFDQFASFEDRGSRFKAATRSLLERQA